MNDMFQLHQLRQNAQGNRGGFASERIKAFHRAVTRDFLHRDWLRLVLLEIEGTPVGADYAFQFKDSVSLYQSGFDPSWSSRSPGSLLKSYWIERAISDGIRKCDFLRGDEPYKKRWGTQSFPTKGLLVVRHRSRYNLAKAVRLARAITRRLAKKLLRTEAS